MSRLTTVWRMTRIEAGKIISIASAIEGIVDQLAKHPRAALLKELTQRANELLRLAHGSH